MFNVVCKHACLVRCLPRMVNTLELELKSENKDQLVVAFGKTNTPAKKL
jgi:hypothetical protein